MRKEDFDEFAQLLDAAYDLIGKTPAAKVISATSKALFFQALQEYPLPQVRAAIAAHIKDPESGKFTPSPAHLVEKIERHTAARDSRPGPEEAWAIALASQDEAETVVWTGETAEAFRIAQPVLAASGAISGRKTFLEAYTRLTEAARVAKRPVKWSAHLGWDSTRQAVVLHKAIQQGLLPAPASDSAQGLLLTHAADLGHLPLPEGATLLLEGPEGEKVPELALPGGPRDQLAKVKQMLADSAAERERRLQAKVDQRNQDEAEFKRTTAQRVQQYQKFIKLADQVQVTRAEGERVEQAGQA
jgi:hypothetical protein